MCFSCSCLKMNIASEHPLFFRNSNWFSLSCGSTIYLILFPSILGNTLLDSDSRLIPYTESILWSPFRFHIGIIMDCLHSIGAIPSFQTAPHTLHSISTPASPAAFIISMLIPSIPGAFPVFADFSQLLIIVFLARDPECLVPKICCLSCPHLDLVTLQSNLPISV